MEYQEQNQEYEGSVQLPIINQKNKHRKIKSRPIIANLVDTQYEIVEQVCWDLDYDIVYQKDNKRWDIRWVDSAVSVQMVNKMQAHQKINHFPGMSILSRKNNLAKNILKMQYKYSEQYSFVPRTFMLPEESALFKNYANQSKRKGNAKTFIVKPQASCQGRGIFLSQDLAQIQAYGQCVVQNYIDNPLLYKGLKFDLRIYALVAGCDPLRIYIYNQGLVRFATQLYEGADQQNLDNLYMHLTNYAINKDSPKYVFNQSLDNLSLGHKKSVAEFFQTLKGLGLPAHEYWSGIKDIIVKTIISGQPHLQHQFRIAQPHNTANNMCFQILGFDFMIAENNKLYLLQINYTPSFSTETPLDHLIKSNLIRDTLVLMNVTPQARNKAQRIAKQELDRRVYTGKSKKLTPQQRQRQANIFQKEKDQYQKNNLGSFQRIYPSRNSQRQKNYEQFLQFSSNEYKEMSSPKKLGHTRRSYSKYRIKKIASNNTTCEQQQRQNDVHKNISKHATDLLYNPQVHKTPILVKKLKDRLSGQSINDIIRSKITSNSSYNVQGINKHKKQSLGQELRQMNLGSLKTKNQQQTMFSRHYRNIQLH